MPSFDYDFAFLQRGIPELQGYLLSKELYWPLGFPAPTGEPPYPRMTLGWLLLAQRRLQGWVNSPRTSTQPNAVHDLSRQLDQMRARWRTAWEKKAAQEFSSRLKLWADFLNEYRGDHTAHASRYGYEVQRRVLLALLAEEAGQISPPEKELLDGMDHFLRAVLKPGGFVWEEEISHAFPTTDCWYLYGSLPKR